MRNARPRVGRGEVGRTRRQFHPCHSFRYSSSLPPGNLVIQSFCSGTPEVPPPAEDQPPPKGVGRINTLWGSCIQVTSCSPSIERKSLKLCLLQKYAKMCIPDLDVLVDYPIDYKWVQIHHNITLWFFLQVSNILQIRPRS